MDAVKNRFYIIKFTTALPYESCCEYECVPSTWMTYHDVQRAIAVIAYPRQPACDADIKLMKKYETNWKQFVVKIVLSTDDLEEARTSLKLFQTDVTTNDSIQEENPDHNSTSNKSQPRTEEARPTPKLDENVRKTLKRKLVISKNTETPLEKVDKTNSIELQAENSASAVDETDEASSNSDNDDEPLSASKVQLLEKLDSIKRILDDSRSILELLEDEDDQSNLTQKNSGI